MEHLRKMYGPRHAKNNIIYHFKTAELQCAMAHFGEDLQHGCAASGAEADAEVVARVGRVVVPDLVEDVGRGEPGVGLRDGHGQREEEEPCWCCHSVCLFTEQRMKT